MRYSLVAQMTGEDKMSGVNCHAWQPDPFVGHSLGNVG